MKFENQIEQVLQFYVHYISVKYHRFRLHSCEGETSGSFDFFNWTLESYVTGRNQLLLLVLISVTCLYRKQSYSPQEFKKITVPIPPPQNLLAAQFVCLSTGNLWTRFSALVCRRNEHP